MIGGDVAHAVAARLDRVHLHGRELGKDVRHVLDLGPVELDVLPRAEVPVSAIPAACDFGQRPQLAGGQEPVWNCNAKHRRMPLNV
jgi:hypothetical protein